MQKILRLFGYIVLGIATLFVTANQLIRVTGGPENEGQGIIYFYFTEKLFVNKNEAVKNRQG